MILKLSTIETSPSFIESGGPHKISTTTSYVYTVAVGEKRVCVFVCAWDGQGGGSKKIEARIRCLSNEGPKKIAAGETGAP